MITKDPTTPKMRRYTLPREILVYKNWT